MKIAERQQRGLERDKIKEEEKERLCVCARFFSSLYFVFIFSYSLCQALDVLCVLMLSFSCFYQEKRELRIDSFCWNEVQQVECFRFEKGTQHQILASKFG